MKKLLSICTALFMVVMVLVTACQPSNNNNNTTAPVLGITPQPITSPPPPKTDWEKGSPPPEGIAGWQQPRPMTEDEKVKVVEIAVNSPEATLTMLTT